MSIGYPDYQSYAQWRGAVFQQNNAEAIPNTGKIHGPFAMYQWSAVHVRVSATVGYFRVRVRWWADAAGTISVGGDNCNMPNTAVLNVYVPSKGPYVTLEFDTVSAAGATAAVTFTPMNGATSRIYYPVTFNPLADATVSIAASGQLLIPQYTIHKGLATVNYVPGDANGKIHLTFITVNVDGTISQNLWDFGNPVASLFQQVVWPDVPVEITLVNTDGAAAHTFSLYVTYGAAE
jgi:hypothetical protein